MKILIVSPYFYPMADVSCVRMNSLCNYLLKKKVEITIIRNANYDNAFAIDSNNPLSTIPTYLVDTKESKNFSFLSEVYLTEFRKAFEKNKYDLVLITLGPFYTLPICSVCEKEFKVPCILDYRDLWIFDVRRIQDFIRPRMVYRKTKAYPIEKKAISSASCIVTVTDSWIKILKRIYKGDLGRYRVISNGYDDELLNKTESQPCRTIPKKGFIISVFGKFAYYSPEYAIKVFNAIEKLKQEGIDVVLYHIGNKEKQVSELIKNNPSFENVYYNTGFIDYGEGVQLLKKSDAVLLVDIRNGAMGTKFYDYVYANRPVIYLGKKNTQLAKLVNGFAGGFVCNDESEICSAIRSIISNKIRKLSCDNDIERYSRTRQNEGYYQLLNEVLQKENDN